MHLIWRNCLDIIEKQVLPDNFSTWFQPTAAHAFDRERRLFTIAVPNEPCKKYLAEHYQEMIESTLEAVTREKTQARYVVTAAAVAGNGNGHKHAAAPDVMAAEDPSFLNSKYMFSNFVVGACNQFAHAASKAVAARPGQKYNPLFIYGSVGLGKTHLIHAIGNAIRQSKPEAKILYVSSEKFTVDLIQSLSKSRMESFRARYRLLDVLIVDDIEFIAGKEQTMQEFFHTFNTLYEAQKQVIVSSDTFPKDMTKLEERLRSRFECGLIADMKPPDLETKIAIIFKECENHGAALPQDVAIFMANSIRSNIRELKGLLLRLFAFAGFTCRKINIELAREVLKDFTRDLTQNFSIVNILKMTAEHFNIKASDIKSKRRARDISVPRQIAMYLCHEYTKSSLLEIGRQFGGKDHSTVIYAHRKIVEMMKEDNEISRATQKIIQKIEHS